MEGIEIKVKEEKIDPEVENKIKAHLTNVSVKQEPLDEVVEDSGRNVESESNSSSESNEEGEVEEKKNVEHVKTSNELLAELFQVFNAAPPEELLNDQDLLRKTQNKEKKKHKKDKKKKHKKHKTNEESAEAPESESNDRSIKKEKHKHKKKKKHKHKDEGKEKKHERSKSKDQDTRQKSKERDRSKKSSEKSNHKSLEISSLENIKNEKADDHKRCEESSSSSNRKRKSVDDSTTEEPPNKSTSGNERRTTNFYNGYKEQPDEDVKVKTEKEEDNTKHQQRKRTNPFYRNGSSDISLSDEETYLKERERLGDKRSQEDYRRSFRPPHNSRNRYEYDRHRRRSRSRERKRTRSRSRDLGIDKKRLLEIARKNAISMFKRGNLPGCANMSEDVKDKVLLQMRYGGRTVQDLTEFCRKISNGEPLPDLSSDNDSDVDKEGNAKAFHHPFQIKERDPIVLQIRNAKPILPATSKKEDLTKAITMQFPVSSGQQHRVTEAWTPVEAKPTTLPPLPPATQSTAIFKVNAQKNVFEKPIPVTAQQEPAFKAVGINVPPAESPTTTTVNNSSVTSTYTPVVPLPVPAPIEKFVSLPPPAFVPDVPVPSSTDSIFPDFNGTSMDVSSIISKRLSALRRLQENPMDSEAINIVNSSQNDMKTWASSKQIPGQFTGSTGVNTLKAHELNSGPQAWARRNQLIDSKPVSGGMGMHLLQKMGWKPGEGLGREKTGALQPLLLDIKLDKRGLVAKEDNLHINGVPPNPPVNTKKRPNNNGQEAIPNFQNKHPVSILNELTSKRKWTPPLYELIREGGPAHSKQFLFSVQMNGQVYTPPDGSNTKKEAKMLAAKFCLQQLGLLPAEQ